MTKLSLSLQSCRCPCKVNVVRTKCEHLSSFFAQSFVQRKKKVGKLILIKKTASYVLVDISTECRPICRSTYRSSVDQYVDRDVSLDISADISVKHRSICRLTLDRYVGRYVDREWLSDCRPTC